MSQTYFYTYVAAQIYVSDPLLRQAARSNLYHLGCRNIGYTASFADLCRRVTDAAADLVVAEVAAGEERRLADLFTQIRHGECGGNPFLPLIAVTARPQPALVRLMVDAGVDDVLPFPWPPGYLDKRLENLIHNRKPFVVTSDYIGPDRRKTPRMKDGAAAVRPMAVPNPLRAKALDRMEPDALAKVVAEHRIALEGDKIRRLSELAVRLVNELDHLRRAGEGMSSLTSACLGKLEAATAAILARAPDTPYATACTACRTLNRTASLMLQSMEMGEEPQLIMLTSVADKFAHEFKVDPAVMTEPPPPHITRRLQAQAG